MRIPFLKCALDPSTSLRGYSLSCDSRFNRAGIAPAMVSVVRFIRPHTDTVTPGGLNCGRYPCVRLSATDLPASSRVTVHAADQSIKPSFYSKELGNLVAECTARSTALAAAWCYRRIADLSFFKRQQPERKTVRLLKWNWCEREYAAPFS